ncbi:MAG: hypothetical protein ACTHLE_02675 [Agriterribacter sp.]
MKKYLLLLTLLTSVFLQTQAQEEDEPDPPKQGFDKSKLFFGGNFGLSFGNSTFINVSPQVGYRFNQYVAAGAGVNFNYSSIKYISNERWRQGYGGLNVFGRFYPFQYAFLQAQPEMNYSWGSIKYGDGSTYKLSGQFVPSLLLGVGAAIPTGGRNGALLLMLQYDAVQAERTPYGNKVFFSLGYNF